MRSHPWLYRIAVLVTVFVLLLGALGYIVYKERPSLGKIASNFTSLHRPRYAPATSAARGYDFRSLFSGIIGPAPVLPPHLSEESTDSLLTRFVDSGDVDVRICDMLGDLREPPPNGAAEVHRWADERIKNRMENPYLESILIPMGAILARPAFAMVATRVRDAAFSGNQTADFDVLLTQAKADLFAAGAELQDVSLHAYHLYSLFKAVNWHPELVNDFATNELCEQIEARLQTRIEGEATGVSIYAESQELLSWMAANRITMTEAGFNPALSGSVSVLVTPTSIEFEMPWMKTALGTGLVLGVPPALEAIKN